MEKSLYTGIQYLKGVGPKKAKLFNQQGIKTIEDLLYHFPRRYEDRSNLLPISLLKENEVQTIQAGVLARRERQSWKRRRFHILEAVVGDDTGKIFCVWFNQPYLKNYFKTGQKLILFGKVQRYSGRLQMNSPEFEIISEEKTDALDAGRIIPIYTVAEGMTQRYFRNILKKALDEHLSKVVEFISFEIRQRNKLLNLAKSLRDIHFPEDLKHPKEAYRRLAFEEFLLFQILVNLRKLKKKQRKGIAHSVDGELAEAFERSLPFELTQAQQRVLQEIKQDMASYLPMSRLLQGDVGSGKTIVAFFAALFAMQSGWQVAFMVPTELLAQQHYLNIKNQISKISAAGVVPEADSPAARSAFSGKNKANPINIQLITSGINKQEKNEIYNKIKQGQANLIIGTHALLEQKLEFNKLGLVIIDEQHKFGVSQRAFLPQRGANPDVLIMTATPIPRTLAITLYGDLDISVIDELPPLRKPVETRFLNEEKREEVYEFIKEQVSQGRQAYIIYPIIEESQQLDLQAASQMYKVLKKETFPDFNIGLVHGQLKTKEQGKIMSEFKRGEIDVLVATTVLEVGIDVANASVMVIEHAERFGLSQLHQLRGRIGRGEHDSYCILISQPQTEDAKRRIKAMVESSDGFRIAEEDLKIRGPGEFFGKRQHGLSELRIANPLRQLQLLKRARQEARELVSSDPRLELRQNVLLRERLHQRFPGHEKYVTVA